MRSEATPKSIGQRLRTWGLSHYKSLAEFARALQIPQPHLSAYLAGTYRPGNKLQQKLRELGCDVDWLMQGGDAGQPKKRKAQAQLFRYRVIDAKSFGNDFRSRSKGRVQEVILDYSPADYVFVRIPDDISKSNTPAIEPDDLLLVDLGRKAKPDALVLARSGSKIAVGIYQPLGGPSIIRPLNPAASIVTVPFSARIYPIVLIRKQ